MVAEILALKDDIADGIGPILTLKFEILKVLRFNKLQKGIRRQNFSPDQANELISKS